MARFDSFKALHQSIAAGREAQETGILRFAAEIAADDDRIAAHTCRTTIHDWIESRVPGALPAEAADHGTFSFRQAGSHCEAVRVLREGHDLWAVRLRSPDPSAPAEAWVTEAGVGWMPGSAPVFHLRLLRSSSGVDARYLEPKVPELAARLASVLELRQFGEPVTGEPWLVTSTPDAERFCARLVDPQRRLPILALSVPDDAEDPHKPSLDAERLARSCLGLALVAVIPAEFAWELTDRFGRRLSVYQGAVRIYLPGFSAQANERDHRLILGLSLSDPEAIERTTNSILRTVAAMSLESQPELPFEEVRRMAKTEVSAGEARGGAPGRAAAPSRPAAAGPAAAPPARVAATPLPSASAAAAAPAPAAPPPPRIVPAREAAAARLGPIPGPTRIPTPIPTPTPAAAPSVPVEPAPRPEPATPAQPFWARSVHSAPRPAARPAASPTRPSFSPGAAAAEGPSSFPSRITPPRFPPATPRTRLPPAEPPPVHRPDPAPGPDPAPAESPSSSPAPAEAAPPAVPPAEAPAPSAPSASEPASPPAPAPSPPPAATPTPTEATPPETPAAPESAEPPPPGFLARLAAALRYLFAPKRAALPALPASTGPQPEPEPEPAAPEEPSPPEPTPAEVEERARLEKEVRTLSLDLDSVRRLLTRTEQEKAKSVDELAEAQERADEAERRFDLAITQQQALADRLIELGEDPEPKAPLPTEWSRFNDWCEIQLAGKVLLTPRAQREVKRAQFADVPLAARCLLWLANDFRDGRLSRRPADRRPFVEDGVHNARCGGDAFAVKWRGKSRRVDWHIKSGGSTHDPRRCLRIYYFWDSTGNQAVVASMPAHIRTAAT